jgi:pyrroline-5-carboxylate reductase
MAEALIRGIIDRGLLSPDSVIVSEPWEPRREYIGRECGVGTTAENSEVMMESDTVILAVKPQVVKVVLDDICSSIHRDHLVISIAAGVTLAALEGGLPKGTRVIRVMPNTPALVQEGAAGLCRGTSASGDDMRVAMSLFNAVGVAVEVPDALMDAVTGLSGSGPAYCFTFLQALIDAGVRDGLSRPDAHKLAVQTMLGSARLCEETGKSPSELTAMVTSPGGTTVEGLYHLERNAFRGAVMDAVRAASLRSKELGK